MRATLKQEPVVAPSLGKRSRSVSVGESLLLSNISWLTYESLLEDLSEQAGMRLTYDQGLLEIMTPLAPHEGDKKLIGRFVETLTEELNIEIRSLGSLTCKREDLARGFEPDECYYIQNESLVWNKKQIDLSQDPPPDLIVEIDVTSHSINKFDLYADFGVPEVWRYDGDRLQFDQLEGKEYKQSEHSLAFPFLQATEIMGFLELRKTTKETALIREFRQWVSTHAKSPPNR
ncbi:MAG: Uma2 family endonuclease [Roseofilum sp. SBFL]|uniref:Uma2 family endonuclease n=1 Tax=unclassified Roseofilum TaxID=2620099 RepID=UPI001B004AB6|nr:MULTISPECIES: Uma2 family endonuclease [unclassified Roseofilum]MBP0012646.1 Uma2 family endonuclease [Roseofilum sp. SID3]MBP0023150.1 Uma2 family endonuclease [Roseofilum sp. SID2]MBP0039956.1 Uma2 family endonuclease [Roseofilum sp. SID1]MBP0042301.1 Uma2 family endonuclease [Roseofilum sp. SBFL]